MQILQRQDIDSKEPALVVRSDRRIEISQKNNMSTIKWLQKSAATVLFLILVYSPIFRLCQNGRHFT